jgi:hypothetical protein
MVNLSPRGHQSKQTSSSQNTEKDLRAVLYQVLINGITGNWDSGQVASKKSHSDKLAYRDRRCPPFTAETLHLDRSRDPSMQGKRRAAGTFGSSHRAAWLKSYPLRCE